MGGLDGLRSLRIRESINAVDCQDREFAVFQQLPFGSTREVAYNRH